MGKAYFGQNNYDNSKNPQQVLHFPLQRSIRQCSILSAMIALRLAIQVICDSLNKAQTITEFRRSIVVQMRDLNTLGQLYRQKRNFSGDVIETIE